MNFKKSLKTKSAIFLGLWSLIIALFFIIGGIFTLHSAESKLMSSALESLLDEIVNYDIAFGHEPHLDVLSRLYIQDDESHDIPERFNNMPLGYSEYTTGEYLHILVKEYDGRKFVLTRYQADFENWERQLFTNAFIIMLVFFIIAGILGFYIVKSVFKPVDKLIAETSAASKSLKAGLIPKEEIFSIKFEDNELGELAESVMLPLKRLRKLYINEKHFTSDVSHELRTPLTVIANSLELLDESKNLSGKDREILDRAIRTSDRMQKTLNMFLNLLNPNRTAETKTLEDIFNESKEDWIKMASEKGLKFEMTFNDNLSKIQYNSSLVGSIINNLVQNAIRYTQKGSICVCVSKNSIDISDTGIGVSEQDRERIFDVGYRGNKTDDQKGFGIGLSIARRCCDALGWTITLHSIQNEGSTFTIKFN